MARGSTSATRTRTATRAAAPRPAPAATTATPTPAPGAAAARPEARPRLAPPRGLALPTWAERLAWPLATVAAAVVVGLVHIRDRAPLVWDESFRVSQGIFVARAVEDGQFNAVWDWLNAQTFYPFLLATLHGVVYLATDSVMVAAWLPSLVGYALAGLLAGRLAAVLGAGRLGAWAAALLAWLVPMLARLGSGGFTEPLGAALLLAVALILAHIGRALDAAAAADADADAVPAPRPARRGGWPGAALALLPRRDLRLALLIGATIALAWFLKYDYGLLAAATTGVTALTVFATRRTLRSVDPFLLAAGLLAVPVLGWLALDFETKWNGIDQFVGQAVPRSSGNPDPFFYPRILFGGKSADETVWLGPGLAPGIALLFLAGVGWALVAARRRAAVRGAAILVVLWYLIYSAANWQDARYMAIVLPTMAGLAGAALGHAVAWYRAAPRPRPVQAGAALVVALLAWQVVQQVVGSAGFVERATFLRPHEPTEQALAFAADSLLEAGVQTNVVMLGHPNELSQHALAIAWGERLGSATPAIVPVPEPGTPQSPRAATAGTLLRLLSRYGAVHVVAIDVRPGSRLDTEDFRDRWPSQPKYVGFAAELERQGVFRRVAETTLENGTLGVVLWELTREPLPPRPTFRGTPAGGATQAELVITPPIEVRWEVRFDRETRAFETQVPVPLPPGSYKVKIEGGKAEPFTVATDGEIKTFQGTAPEGAERQVGLIVKPAVAVRWTAAVDPTTGAFETQPPVRLPTGVYSLSVNGQKTLDFLVAGE